MSTILKNRLFKYVISSALIMFVWLQSTSYTFAEDDMTPYSTYQLPGTFWQGAMYDLTNFADLGVRISHDLQDMKDNYHINCLNLYGLESLSTNNKNLLFNELKRLEMQAVIRIEGYNGSTMNFEEADADAMINNYNSLISYACDPARRDQVAYFSLNVPVDDNTVAENFVTSKYPNGRNNPLWGSSQVTFVTRFVTQMRNKCTSYGFNDAKMYVSVFYGWDYSYTIPSYVSSNADGYFFNNYSYPQNFSSPPDEKQSDAVIINQTRLQKAMNKFMAQYPTQNKIIEYGFHTSEFNAGAIPNQVAGLVKTRAAKRIALKATTNYYSPTTFPGMRGTLYFGWNLLKEEGTPLSLLDWCLDYPKKGKVEAEKSLLNGHAAIFTDTIASNKEGVSGLDSIGDGLTILNVSKNASFDIRYACMVNSHLSLYMDGQYKQKISLPATGTWTGKYAIQTVTINIPWRTNIKLQRNSGDNAVNIDYLKFGEGYISDIPIETGLKMNDNPLPNIRVYPNPFNYEVRVRLPIDSDFNRIIVLNGMGQVVESKRIEEIHGELVLGSGYHSGVYLIQFISEKVIETKIAIKN